MRAGGEGDNGGWDGLWHHWLDGHEFEQVPGIGDGQGSLVCGTPWGLKESDMTKWLHWMYFKVHSRIIYNCQDTEAA